MSLNSDIAKATTRNNNDMLVSKRGGLVIADTSPHTGAWGAIQCETDAVIASMKLNGSTDNATLNNYCTANRSAGNLYIFAETDTVTSITLSSGRVNMINT